MTGLLISARMHRNPRTIAICWAVISTIAALLILAIPGTRAQNNAPPGEKSDAAPAGNKENGKNLYLGDGCFECHGKEGQGAVQATGPRIGPPQLSFESFAKYLRHPAGQMPPYTAKVISDRELADIYAFLQSKPKAAPAKDIPLLNQ
jgi:mono/diheme cytochrome c family protein